MTPLTEAELLRMREVQAKATPGPCQVNRFDESNGTISYQVQQEETGVVLCEFPDLTSPNPRAKQDAAFDAQARTDWPRLTKWALEARTLMRRLMPKGHKYDCQLDAHGPGSRGTCTCGYAEARRLLGE